MVLLRSSLMKYKLKLKILSITIGVLALACILGLIFDPERMVTRTAAYSWLDPKTAASAEIITITNVEQEITLANRNNTWFVLHDDKEYPARQLRVADFISVLTRRAAYQVRSNSITAHERLGLDENSAARIVVYGPYKQTILDLLVGPGDVTGQNIYLRTFDSNEARSGEDIISSYLFTGPKPWYNLRLIPETEADQLDIDKVQRLSVYYPADETGTDVDAQIFTRKGRQWTFNRLNDAELDMSKVTAYIRSVLMSEGEDYSDEILSNDPRFNNIRIVIELGNSDIKTIFISAPDDEEKQYAVRSGSNLVYSLSNWMVFRILNSDDHYRLD